MSNRILNIAGGEDRMKYDQWDYSIYVYTCSSLLHICVCVCK